MKKNLLFTLVALAGTAAFAHAQQNPVNSVREAARNATGQNLPGALNGNDQGRAAAQKALDGYYKAAAKVRITGERNVNGVRVYDAEVSAGSATAMASATANGDLIETGMPSSATHLPEPVRQITQGLFQTPPTDVDRVENHYYYAQVNAGGQPFMVNLDATGKILSVKSTAQLKEDQPKNAKTVGGAERDQVQKLAQKHFPEAKITDIREALHAPGFYAVLFTAPNGPGYIILDPRDDEVAMFHVGAKRNSLPQPVQQALNTILKGDKIGNVGVGADKLYRVAQTAGNLPITLWVHADGDVERIDEGAQRAMTAGHRTSGK